ncbi:MAG TPA: amidohydrolase family protein [Candidatus Limnocylindrales bacterium]|nr:amidohydrolase family protein [Candidatus Limnocylindrales bacterium]
MALAPNRARFCVFVAAIVVAACALWSSRASGEGGEPPYFAITNARIVPVSGPPIEGGTIVITKGLIQAVGANVTIPPEAWVVDGKGLTVYPGLIDAGTNIGLQQEGGEGGAPMAGGRGARRAAAMMGGPIARGPEDRPGSTPWRVAADEFKTDDKRIESWRSAGFTTVLSAPEGGMLPGQGSIIDLAGERAGDFVVKPQATLQVSFRPAGGFFGFPDSLMGSIAYIRQVLDDASWYAESEPIYLANPTKSERIPYDRTERVVSQALANKELVILPEQNSVQILRGLRLAKEWNIHAALFGAQGGYAVADAIGAAHMPVIVSLKWPERPKDVDPEAEQTLRDLRFRDRAPGTPAALAKMGVTFAFSSDGLSGPKDILKNVKKSIDAGLAPDAALRALTLDAAGILGASEQLGSIEPGKIANLVVTDGDIFNEKTKVKDVFVDGKFFEIHAEASPLKPPHGGGEQKPMRAIESQSAAAGLGAGR